MQAKRRRGDESDDCQHCKTSVESVLASAAANTPSRPCTCLPTSEVCCVCAARPSHSLCAPVIGRRAGDDVRAHACSSRACHMPNAMPGEAEAGSRRQRYNAHAAQRVSRASSACCNLHARKLPESWARYTSLLQLTSSRPLLVPVSLPLPSHPVTLANVIALNDALAP